MFEDIFEVKTSKKDSNGSSKSYIIGATSSWDAMDYHAIKPHIIRRGFEKAFESMGINVSISFELLDKREYELAPRWCFTVKLEDQKEN